MWTVLLDTSDNDRKDQWRVFLTLMEYRALLANVYHNGKSSLLAVKIQIRLMACSLRVGTVARLKYGQFYRIARGEDKRWMLRVEAKNSTDHHKETRSRHVFIPDDLMEDIERYVEKNNKSEDEELFDVSKSVIYDNVKRSAEKAADAEGEPDFRKVSPHDLRRYFATHLLYRHGLSSEVVQQLGGWKSEEAMYAYLSLPEDVLFRRLDEAGLLGSKYDKESPTDPTEQAATAISRLADSLDQADGDLEKDEKLSIYDKLEQAVSGTPWLEVDYTLYESDVNSESEPDTPSTVQAKITEMVRDTDASASMGTTVRLAYTMFVVAAAWTQTFGAV